MFLAEQRWRALIRIGKWLRNYTLFSIPAVPQPLVDPGWTFSNAKVQEKPLALPRCWQVWVQVYWLYWKLSQDFQGILEWEKVVSLEWPFIVFLTIWWENKFTLTHSFFAFSTFCLTLTSSRANRFYNKSWGPFKIAGLAITELICSHLRET